MAEESIIIRHKWYIISASLFLFIVGLGLTIMGAGDKDKDGKPVKFSDSGLQKAGVGMLVPSGLILVAYLLMTFVL
jgi:hypothetical protein